MLMMAMLLMTLWMRRFKVMVVKMNPFKQLSFLFEKFYCSVT